MEIIQSKGRVEIFPDQKDIIAHNQNPLRVYCQAIRDGYDKTEALKKALTYQEEQEKKSN